MLTLYIRLFIIKIVSSAEEFQDSDLENILEKIARVKEFVKESEEAVRILEEVEESLRKYDLLAYMAIKKLSRRNNVELAPVISKMKKDVNTKKFFLIASSPWIVNKTFQRLMQVLWIVTASIAFLMGIYLFFPPYIFFGQAHGNVTSTVQKTLMVISENPRLLAAIDPIFKIIGFVMMAIAIVSLYQAHLISVESKEIENV